MSGPFDWISNHPQADEIRKLLNELHDIGKDIKFPPRSDGEVAAHSGYFRPDGVGSAGNCDGRTMEIGQRLHDIGDIDVMRKAHEYVTLSLGNLEAHDLSSVWHGVGSWRH